MHQLLRLSFLFAAAGALAGCVGLSTDAPYPVMDSSPNPRPVPGYVVRCQSAPNIVNFITDGFDTACQQYLERTRRTTTTVIRAKG